MKRQNVTRPATGDGSWEDLQSSTNTVRGTEKGRREDEGRFIHTLTSSYQEGTSERRAQKGHVLLKGWCCKGAVRVFSSKTK